MWGQTGGEENKPVPVKTICEFNRMRRFQPYSAVIAALKESSFLEVSGEEDAETVKRKVAYRSVPEAQKKRLAKSVYIKGFGEEGTTTQVDIETWLKQFGAVDRIKLRRTTPENTFKGSIFVEFQTEEIAKSFVALDPQPTFQDKELKIMMKSDYLDEKTRMIRAGEMEPSKHHPPTFYEGKEKKGFRGRGGRGQGRGNHQGKGDSNDWKKRREDEQNNGSQNGRGGRGRGRGGRGRGGRSGRGGRGGRDDREKRDDRRESAPRSNNK